MATSTPTTGEPRPYIAPEITERVVTGTSEPTDVALALNALSNVCEDAAAILARGIRDEDAATMHRLQATAEAVNDAFRALQHQRAVAERQQARLPFVWGFAGASDPLAVANGLLRTHYLPGR